MPKSFFFSNGSGTFKFGLIMGLIFERTDSVIINKALRISSVFNWKINCQRMWVSDLSCMRFHFMRVVNRWTSTFNYCFNVGKATTLNRSFKLTFLSVDSYKLFKNILNEQRKRTVSMKIFALLKAYSHSSLYLKMIVLKSCSFWVETRWRRVSRSQKYHYDFWLLDA